MSTPTTYVIDPLTTEVEKILYINSIPYTKKGNTAQFHSRKDFVRAAFQLVAPHIPTSKDMVKGVL